MTEKTVKVCTYNVQMKDQAPGQAYENKTRAKLIAGLLAKSDYDVLVFEEAFDNEARAEMGKILSAEGNFNFGTAVVGYDDEFNPYQHPGTVGLAILGGVVPGAIGTYIGGLGLALGGVIGGLVVVGAFIGTAIVEVLSGHPKSDGGIFMMSRWPIMLQSQIVYKDGAGWDRYGKKGVSWALINKEGLYFNVFGTHTQADAAAKDVDIRHKQFEAFRAMIDGVQMYWQPALLAGDMNVDYCFASDRCPNNDYPVAPAKCCSDKERENMLRVLKASLPRDLTKYVYSSDPANDINDDDKATTLDYVLSSNSHLAPIRSSLETVRLQAPWTYSALTLRPQTGDHHDLSDHYAVVGTFTFPLKREDTNLFTGSWKCIEFNGHPDVHKHRITLNPFGISVVNEFDGKTTVARIYDIQPGGENGGKIVFKQLPSGTLIEYQYAFNRNNDFVKYFIPGDKHYQQKTRPQNELLLRNQDRKMLYAFESWPPVDPFERPGRGPV